MSFQDHSQALRAELARERSILRNVYLWMTLGLAITGVAAWYVANNQTLYQAITTNRALFFGLVIAELMLVFTISRRVQTMRPEIATLAFAAYSVLNGATLSVILRSFAGVLVAQAFFVTAGTFAALSIYALTTKRELGGMGQYLFAGLIGLIIASVVNVFVRSSGFDMLISYAGVVIFMGLTAYDTQMIKRWSAELSSNASEADYVRISILGALRLYLDFINMFLFILRILGNRR